MHATDHGSRKDGGDHARSWPRGSHDDSTRFSGKLRVKMKQRTWCWIARRLELGKLEAEACCCDWQATLRSTEERLLDRGSDFESKNV